MDKRVALVTGGTRGIGKALVERFVRDGYKVVFTGRSQVSVDAAFPSGTESVRGVVCDISDATAVKALFETIQSECGRLDVLINNAGITRDGLVLRMKPDAWDEVLDTNLKGAFLCSQAAARPMMKNTDGGRIINMTSVIGLMGNAGQVNYAASKAGLIGLTKSLAKEFGSRNILVNAVAPGFIETDMTSGLSEEIRSGLLGQIPTGRLGTGADVAGLCAFLAGPDAAYITGQVFQVDGGLLM